MLHHFDFSLRVRYPIVGAASTDLINSYMYTLLERMLSRGRGCGRGLGRHAGHGGGCCRGVCLLRGRVRSHGR